MSTVLLRASCQRALQPGLMGLCLELCLGPVGWAGTLTGYVRDSNWYARYQGNPYGVGCYEFAVNASGSNGISTVLFGAAATDVFGRFQMPSLPAGTYQVGSWDVWWRSAYAFNVNVPAVGSSPVVELRLPATMWGYPAFWDDQGYFEFGQTFVARGPISMIYLRCPYNTTYALTVHTNGPGGAQVGVARTFTGGDQRPIYGYGDLPTVAGGRYYLRVRTSTVRGVLMQMDPRPDFSDPMPEGCLHLGDSTAVTPFPDRDLGVVIMSDDDGLLTNLHTRQSGGAWSATRIGQSFIARGVSLVSAAFWLADPTAPTYEMQLYDSPARTAAIGLARRGKPARLSADPEMGVIWPPGTCPLTPGQTYYLEVRKVGGGTFNAAYVNTSDPYPFGHAYRDDTAMATTDLAGTIMEEASAGSATRPAVRIISDPTVAESDRGTNDLTVRWTTDVPADSVVEIAPRHPPYTRTVPQTNLVLEQVVTLRGLRAHTMHHFRVSSRAEGLRPAVSRDLVVCTRASTPNLLANPGFEAGTGSSPRKPVTGWSTSGPSLDMAASDGSWFWGLPPHSGQWLFEGAVNSSTADGCLYQRVAVTPGKEYTFSAWVGTWMRENNTWKYDVWNDRNRLSHVRLGIDPQGGTSPTAARVQWTPRFYSHLRMANVGKTVVAQASLVTVFVEMKGSGGEWHLFGVDDCVLTETPATPPEIIAIQARLDGDVALTVRSDVGASTTLEGTEDFANWTALTNWLSQSDETDVWDPDAPAHRQRFYRARTP